MHDYAPSKNTIFQSVTGDPIQVQMHTLANGLRLFLSVNTDEPRVYTEIAVRAGSKHDPADTTGLAHYFEHMMFKGTDRLGSLDWPQEKALLDQIELKFEAHRKEQDPAPEAEEKPEADREDHGGLNELEESFAVEVFAHGRFWRVIVFLSRRRSTARPIRCP